jgi:hypothetical protein
MKMCRYVNELLNAPTRSPGTVVSYNFNDNFCLFIFYFYFIYFLKLNTTNSCREKKKGETNLRPF